MLLITAMQVSGQGGFKQKYYPAPNITSVCRNVIETPSGNFIMVGLVYDTLNGIGFNRLSIFGTDSQGNQLWRKNYGNNKFQHLDNILATRGAIAQDNIGFFYAAVVKDSNDVYLSVLIKFNYAGDTLWQKRYYSNLSNINLYFQAITKTVDGGLLMAGIFEDFNVGSNQESILLLKTDINGNELWRKKLISPNTINPVWSALATVQDTASKKIIIVGYQIIGNTTQSLIMATDSLGVKLWQTTFNNPQGAGFNDVIQTKDKNFVSGGRINVNNNIGSLTRSKSLVVKFDINGNSLWSKTYDTLSAFTGVGFFNELSNGDLVMGAGLDTVHNYGPLPVVKLRIIKTDKNGNLKWKKYVGSAYNFNTSEYMRSMNPTQDGGFIIASWLATGPNPQPYSIVKIDSTGCDTLAAYCKSLATGITNFTEITGFGINVYPNPATNFVNIVIDAPVEKTYLIKICDVLGNVIAEQAIEPNTELQLNTQHYPAGIYFISIGWQGKTLETRRLVIVK